MQVKITGLDTLSFTDASGEERVISLDIDPEELDGKGNVMHPILKKWVPMKDVDDFELTVDSSEIPNFEDYLD